MCEFTQESWKKVSVYSGGANVHCSHLENKDFPKYVAPGPILSGRKWWPLPVHVMMSSHFWHNESTPVQISLQYLHWY